MQDDRTDAEVISTSLRDPEVFAVVFDRHAAALAGYLVRRVGEPDGESLVGETFRIAFESRSRFDPGSQSARPWLYGIAARLVMKHFRTQRRHHKALSRAANRFVDLAPALDDGVVEESHWVFLWDQVSEAIVELPERDREVVMLYAFGGLTYADIAISMGIPAGTVRSRLHRVRVEMRRIAEVHERTCGEVSAESKEPE